MAYIESHWRRHAAPIIAAILAKFPEGPERSKALRDAYPFGERRYHPYKIWLDEIKKQTGGRRVIAIEPAKKLVFGDPFRPYGEDAR